MLVLTAGVTGQSSEDGGDLAGHWTRDYLATAQGARMVEVYPDGSLCPDRLVTRADLATMIACYLGLKTKPAAFRYAAAHCASGWIGEMVEKWVLAGYPDGAFRPDAPVSRAEAAKVIALAFVWR